MNKIADYPLWTAMITPFNEDLTVDYDSFEILLKRQEEAGNGILILGSTGENLSLSLDEKKEIVEFTTKLNLKVPIMCGVGGTNINESLSWIDYLNSTKVNLYLMVSPLYTKPGAKGQTEWFKRLLDKSTKPAVLYNVPSRTGKKLEQLAVSNLANHKNFVAIKEASGSVDEFALYKEAASYQLLFSGDDSMMPYFSTLGAAGLISVISNVWPKETKEYTLRCLNKDYDGLFPLWKEASESMFVVSNPIPSKALLYAKGIIKTPKLRLPLSHEELENLDYLKEVDAKVNNWFKNIGK